MNTWFHSVAVAISGQVTAFDSLADSGTRMRRGFCPRCGTQVFTQSDDRPDLLGVRSGTLDDVEQARPSITVWTASAPSWACIDARLPQLTGQPGPAA